MTVNAKKRPLPDIAPPARLAVVDERRNGECILDEAPQYELLCKTVKTTVHSSGRFPTTLKNGDIVSSLVDEAIARGVSLLGKSDEDLIAGAKSIARQSIYRLKKIAQPVAGFDDAGKFAGWISPLDDTASDAFGKNIGVPANDNRNQTEDAMLRYFDDLLLINRVIDLVGATDFKKLADIAERTGDGTVTNAERQWFFRQKIKIENRLLPRNKTAPRLVEEMEGRAEVPEQFTK